MIPLFLAHQTECNVCFRPIPAISERNSSRNASLGPFVWPLMGDDAKRFHDRARDCLNVAKGARHQADRIILEEMAAELEAEAKRIDAEEAAKSKTVEPRQPD